MRRAERWHRPSARAALVMALAAAIVLVDRVAARYPAPPLALAALLDEAAHLATALLFLVALRVRPARAVVWGTALGAVAIDVDHLPGLFGSEVLSEGTGRPYSHSLLTLLVLLLAAFRLPVKQRPLARGLAFGLAAHLIRDMASTTAGVPLFWPVAWRGIRLPYGLYVATLVVAAGLVIWRAWTSRDTTHAAHRSACSARI